MNNHFYLIEVGLEEMPAQYVRSVSQQFQKLVEAFLKEERLTFESTQVFATPRRFAVLVKNLADKQIDFSEVAKGPAKTIAMDEEGNWTKAAQGFVRGKGLTTDDIYFETINGKEYAHIKVESPGQPAVEVLPKIKDCITQMTFPVAMFWTNHDFRYIRPVHWIVSLLDKEVVPFEVMGLQAGRKSRGHRFLHPDSFELTNAVSYEERLAEMYIVADQDKRKAMIQSQLQELEETHHFHIMEDDDLLEEVTQLVEYPTAFVGEFDEKYLALPAPVLITSMREHQRYFAVEDQKGNLLPRFIALRNGTKDGLESVKAGNEKVLVARLEDAMFFVKEDKEVAIDDFAKKLTHVTFHAKIGSLKQKMERTGVVANFLYSKWAMEEVFASQLASDFKPQISRLQSIYKFDLVTQMVDEFSELQGVIGEIYAKEAGEDEAVAIAIREHYLPNGSESELPQTPLGILMAIADKLETIISFFAIGKAPSGSNDPFALRRQMIGIVTLLAHYHLPFEWHTDLKELLDLVYDFDQEKESKVSADLLQFVSDRLKNTLESEGIRYDISQAVREAEIFDVLSIIETAKTLNHHTKDDHFKANVEAWQRISNLKAKAEELHVQQATVNPDLFETSSEKELCQAVKGLNLGEFEEENYQELEQLTPLISRFFEENMVFTEDEAIRNNRLTLLKQLARPLAAHFNVQEIVNK